MIKHKFALILAATFSSVLLISVVVLSILQSSTKPDLPNPDTVKIYLNSTSANKTYTKGTEEYNKIMKLYSDAFEKSFLNQIADNNILERNISENISASTWNDSNTRTGVYMELIFNETKNYIIYRNGNSRRVNINTIIFQLTKENEFKKVNVYYTVEKLPSGSSSDKTDEIINYPLLVEANTSKLYNFAISND